MYVDSWKQYGQNDLYLYLEKKETTGGPMTRPLANKTTTLENFINPNKLQKSSSHITTTTDSQSPNRKTVG